MVRPCASTLTLPFVKIRPRIDTTGARRPSLVKVASLNVDVDVCPRLYARWRMPSVNVAHRRVHGEVPGDRCSMSALAGYGRLMMAVGERPIRVDGQVPGDDVYITCALMIAVRCRLATLAHSS